MRSASQIKSSIEKNIFKNGASAELPAGALFLCKEKRVSVTIPFWGIPVQIHVF